MNAFGLRPAQAPWAVCDTAGVVLACDGPPFVAGQHLPYACQDVTALLQDDMIIGRTALDGGHVLLSVLHRLPAPCLYEMRVIGGFRLMREGARLVQQQDMEKGHELLFAVALADGPMTRTEIASVLWPGPDQKAAKDSLKSLLTRLPLLQDRAGAPEPLARVVEHGVQLNRDMITFDVDWLWRYHSIVSDLVARGEDLLSRQVAARAMAWLLTDQEGGVREEDLQRFPQLRQLAGSLEIEVTALVACATGADLLDELEVRLLVRRGMLVSGSNVAMTLVAGREALRLRDEAWFEEIYATYLAASAMPMSLEEMREMVTDTRWVINRRGLDGVRQA